MYAFLKKLLLFFTLFVVCYPIAILLFSFVPTQKLKKNILDKTGAYGHMNTRLKEAETIRNIDVLFLGSSHAYRGFDPRLFQQAGYRSFNLGSSSQSHIQTQQLLHQYLEQLSPDLVIYEVFPGTLQVDGVESSLDVLANGEIDRYALSMVLNVNHVKTYNAFILHSMYTLLGIDDNYQEDITINEDTYITGGFVEKELRFNEEVRDLKTRWKINPKQLQSLKENIAFIRGKGIEVLLVMAPINKTNYARYANRSEVDSIYNLLAAGQYINYNKRDLELSDSIHFYDTHHLNQNGVEAFNKELIQELPKYLSSK